MAPPAGPGRRVVVIGGGIVGLSCADALVESGHDVRVIDPAPAEGATRAAAGMLAPGGEAWFGEEALLRLGLASLRLWPEFAARLTARTGHDLDWRASGSLFVAADHDDLADLRRTCALLERSDVRVDELDRRELRQREPSLSGRVRGGAFLPDAAQVNPRRVASALLHSLGDRVIRSTATLGPTGVVLADGTPVDGDVVVIATGANPEAGVHGPPRVHGVRPVRGEIVRVRSRVGPHHVLRARVHGQSVYVVPRSDGELVIGATEEERPGEGRPHPTVGGVAVLLDAARTLVPSLDTAEILEVLARDRPGSPDNGPVIGPVESVGRTRVVVAGGHYRGGVLLAPITAAAVCAHVSGVDVPEPARSFTPERWTQPARATPTPEPETAPPPPLPTPSSASSSAPDRGEPVHVKVNGRTEELPESVVLSEAVAQVTEKAHGFAVALNGSVVRAADWSRTVVREGDAIEIVSALQGG